MMDFNRALGVSLTIISLTFVPPVMAIGNGTFAPAPQDGNSNTFGLGHTWPGTLTNTYIADFNGDGKSDILRQEKGEWENDALNMIQVYLGQGNGTFSVAPQDGNSNTIGLGHPWKDSLTNIYIGDFNGDGKSDILRQEKGVWENDARNMIQVYLGQGNGTFIAAPQDGNSNTVGLGVPWNGSLTDVYVGDFNGDGKSDLIRQEKGRWASENALTGC